MSDDLISREYLLNHAEYDGNGRLVIPYKTVENAPTAFDKEKVIEQLHRCRVYQFQGTLPDGRVCHFSDVIEIVEKGGIE